jgi:prevent-host-death family protein
MATWPWPRSRHEVDRRRQVQGSLSDEVAATKSTVVITKRGRPVAQLVPFIESVKRDSLADSIVKETGDPFGTGEGWETDDDAS